METCKIGENPGESSKINMISYCVSLSAMSVDFFKALYNDLWACQQVVNAAESGRYLSPASGGPSACSCEEVDSRDCRSMWSAPFPYSNECDSTDVQRVSHRASCNVRQARNFDSNTRWVPTLQPTVTTSAPALPRHSFASDQSPAILDASAALFLPTAEPSVRHVKGPKETAARPSVCGALPTGMFFLVLVGPTGE